MKNKIGLGLLALAISGCQSTSQPSIADVLNNTVNELNKTTPQMVDNATRLDTTYVTGNKFVYKYTLINHNVAELDIQVFHQAMLNQVTGFVCSSPDMVFFVDNKIDVGYHYVDKNEQFISEAVVITANCQK